MKRTKLVNKIAATAMSLFACATCLGVATLSNVEGVADDAKVTLAGGTWTNVGDYSLTWGSSGAVANAELYATPVAKTNALGQSLKGVELSSNQEYKLSNSQWYPVNGSSMGYGQYLTLKVNDTIDMSEPVEFLFSPYVIGGTGGQANHRFVMALSDGEGQVKPLTGNSKNGFNTEEDTNYVYWEFLKHQQWANAAAPETQGNGPSWYAVSSEGTAATGYSESYDNIGNAPTKDGVPIANSRIAGGALARAFYGVDYLWKDIDSKYTVNSSALIKAKFEFTETQLILTFDHVFEEDLSKKEPNYEADKVCTATHDLSVESGVTCTTCYFKQTYNLADLGFTYGESELNLYFGYYNVHARFGGQSYGNLPMSLKLYNYKNGDVKSVTAKNETVSMKASEELNLADQVNVAYFDGATATPDVTFTSNNDAVATIVDGKLVPVAGTKGGNVTITATAGGKTATFTVTVDANTVTLNGNVIGAGDSYTILEDLYAGNHVLVGYKANGNLYAVGDTITLTDDIVLEEVTIDFTMLYGASIRLDATASIRFTAVINTADVAALEVLIGVENVSYGMTLVAGENTYKIDSKDENFQTGTYENDYTLYSAVMKGIPASDYETELTANGYLKVTYADGDVVELAAKIAEKKDGDAKASNVRSLADVATAAYNDRKATQEGDYKYAVEGGFSPYTSAQLEEIAKYMPKAGE